MCPRTAAKESPMKFEALKVGELARRTGLTVRTLHHYDEIGLLRPSLHTDSGHRLYTGDDVARLQEQIELQRGLCDRLEAIAGYFRPAGEVSADAFLQTIEVMNMIANY